MEKKEDMLEPEEIETATKEEKDKTVQQPIAEETQPVQEEKDESALSTPVIELLQEIKSLIEGKVAYDETKEKMFQVLYQQLKEYKEGLVESIQKPIIKTLLPLYDSIVRLEEKANSKDFLIENLKNEVDVLKTDIVETLYRMEVVPFSEHPETLDRNLHKTIKVVETSDPEEDKQVVEILRNGFYWKDKILRPEEVVIKRHSPQENKEGGSNV